MPRAYPPVLMAGCGDLGTEIGLRFAATGREVYGLRRSPERLPAEINGIATDLSREVPEVPAGTEVVVMVTTADERTAEGYRRSYRDALANLLAGLDRAEVTPRRFCFISSTAVYGSHEGPVDEDTPAEPDTGTGAVLRETEQLLHQRLPGAVVLRLAGLCGPGRTRLIDQVRHGEAVPGDPDRYTNRIHRDDAAAAVVHLATRAEEPAPVYVGVDDQPAPRNEVLAFLAAELGVSLPAPADPAWDPAAVTVTGRQCRNDRLLATGFRFGYPTFREGYRAVLAGAGDRHS